MDSEKDEGYISPQESVDGPVQPKVIHVNSWDTSVSARCNRRHLNHPHSESGIHTDSYSLQDLAADSSVITDNLWLTFPEASTKIKVEPGLEFGVAATTITDTSGEIIPGRVPELKRIKLGAFLSDLMDLICGKPSSTFLLDEYEGFGKNPSVVVEGLTPMCLNNICQPFLETGSTVVRLSNVDQHFHFQTFSLSEQESKVWVKLIKFVKDFLKVYQTIVMLNRPSMVTLSGLRRFVHPFQQQIRTLWDIIDAHVFANPALLLKNLNDFMMQTEVPWICEMLQNLLVSCAASYTQYVADWIYRGELKSKLEFHIIKNRIPLTRDRHHWISQFAQNDEIPLFIQHLKGQIFETGRALSLLKELCDQKLPPCLEYNRDLFIPLETSHSKILDLMQAQDSKMADTLSKNSYLESGIAEAMDFGSFKYDPIDMEAIRDSHKECAERAEAERLEKLMKARAKKQGRLAEILQDMERARMDRLQRAIDDLFEDKKIENQRLEMVASQRGADLLNRLYGIVMDPLEASCSGTITSQNSVNFDALSAGDGFGVGSNDDELKMTGGLCGSDGVGDVASAKDPAKDSSESEVYFTARTEMSASEMSCAGVPELVEEMTEQSVETSSRSFSWSDNDLKTKPVLPFKLSLEMFDAPLLPPAPVEPEEDNSEDQDVFLTNRFLSLSVEIPLLAQSKFVHLALLHFIIVEKQLFRHLKALQDYALVQNGLFGKFLATALLEKIDKNVSKGELPAKVLAFNCALDDVLLTLVDSEEFKFLKRMRFDIIRDASPRRGKEEVGGQSRKKQGILSEYEVLNAVCLRYQVEWPLNLILTEEFLKKAEQTFVLQMQLQRVEILLGKATVALKGKAQSQQVLELNNYRHHMLHFVRSLQTYINMVVIQPSWSELTQALSKVTSLEQIYELVVHYIKSASSNMLLGPKAKPIMKLLTSQLVVIEAFCSKVEGFARNFNFTSGQQLKSKDNKMLLQHYLVFTEIQSVFAKAIFTASQKGYYPKISHFAELFNFNGFYANLSGI